MQRSVAGRSYHIIWDLCGSTKAGAPCWICPREFESHRRRQYGGSTFVEPQRSQVVWFYESRSTILATSIGLIRTAAVGTWRMVYHLRLSSRRTLGRLLLPLLLLLQAAPLSSSRAELSRVHDAVLSLSLSLSPQNEKITITGIRFQRESESIQSRSPIWCSYFCRATKVPNDVVASTCYRGLHFYFLIFRAMREPSTLG